MMKFRNKKDGRVYKNIAALLLISLVLIVTTAGTYSGDNTIDDVKQLLKIYYVDDLPQSVYDKTAVSDVLNEVNKTDPYTKYYTANKYKQFIGSINNETSGIGVYIEMVPEGAKIISVLSDSEEKAAGLLEGDIILMADSHLLVGLTQDTVIRYLKGEPGTVINLKIKRGTELKTIKLYRSMSSNSTVGGQILDNHIGYIRITSFSDDSAELFGQLIQKFESLKGTKRIDSYIIDLTYNGGGFLAQACDIAGYFLGDKLVAKTKGKLVGEKSWYGKFHGLFVFKPVVFLVNKYTASASEVFVSAMKDYNRAYVIGTKTYGKGSVQWPARLSNNDVLKLTIERWYSPKGNSIDKTGINPDVTVIDEDASKYIAELILDSNFTLDNTKGYVKVNFNNKTAIFNLVKVQNSTYWQAYKCLLDLALKNGSVFFGNGTAWTPVPKQYLSDVMKMYYPSYNESKTISNVSTHSDFTLHFGANIKKSSYNNKNIELIDIQTGKRVPLYFYDAKDNQVSVSPLDDLKGDNTYYIIEHPNIIRSDNKPIGIGKIIVIKTAKA